MNKILLVLVVIGLLAVPVFAQTGESTNASTDSSAVDRGSSITVSEAEVGALPGDMFYGFKRVFEDVDKFFTFDKAEKAKKHAKYGRLRALEAYLLTGRVHQLAVEGKYADAQANVGRIEKLALEQNEENKNAQTELEAAVDEGSATQEDVKEVESEMRHSIIVLQRVYEKVPEPAKDAILHALNNSINNQQKHMERMEENGMARKNMMDGRGSNETAKNRSEGDNGKVEKGDDTDKNESEEGDEN